MHPCPHCHQATFSTQRKLLQLWLHTGTCSNCHKQAFVPLRNVIAALFIWVIFCWIFIATALYMRSVLFLFGAIPAAMLALDKCLVQAPLAAQTDDD